jgi:hypothetical protein
MPVNRVNATVTPAQIEAVQGAFKVIYENLPFLIDLKPDERQGMAKFGEKNRSFVSKAAAIASQNPDIFPRSFNLDDMTADVSIVEDLYPLIPTNLLGKLEGTYRQAPQATPHDARASAHEPTIQKDERRTSTMERRIQKVRRCISKVKRLTSALERRIQKVHRCIPEDGQSTPAIERWIQKVHRCIPEDGQSTPALERRIQKVHRCIPEDGQSTPAMERWTQKVH